MARLFTVDEVAVICAGVLGEVLKLLEEARDQHGSDKSLFTLEEARKIIKLAEEKVSQK